MKKKQNLPRILEIVLIAISVVLIVVFFLSSPITMNKPILDIVLWWAYILVFVAVILALAFALAGAFKSRKNVIRLLIGIAAVVVICGACYLLAPGGPVNTTQAYTAKTSKLVDAGLYLTYFMLGITVIALLYAIISRAFKK
ncbi:MAG: hypothetical protein LKK19_01195 [Bacteroidales bacterium]|jgi:hypothetical protein|nr:hypothetical protein [Bacteroidales bacterium]MCI2121303.1 hypothetical protein [Bacteroidales bacterium]MCI2145207.1 hypothetical protein [Bacteroidales bacterium]